MITSELKQLVLNTVVGESVDKVDVISVSNSLGEIFRKTPQNIEVISPTEKKFTFYLTESEAVDNLTKFSLYGQGATLTLGTGVEMARQTTDINKTNTQSLLISWTVKVEYGVTGVGITTASELPYVNTTSGLTATNVQSGIDEVQSGLTTHKAGYATEADLGHVKVDGNTINIDANGIISAGTPGNFRYGFKIDKAEPDPFNRVEYMYDAVGMVPAKMDTIIGDFIYGSWKGFSEYVNAPVMLNYDGSVAYMLDRNDQTKKADGTASDVASTAFAGNAMSQFRKLYVKRWEDSTHEYVVFSDKKWDATYLAYAHTDGSSVEKDYFYYAMYEGTFVTPHMRSMGVGTPFASETSTTEINRAVENGAGWWTIVKSQWDYINDLLTLISKSTNSQLSFGNGNSNSGAYLAAGTLKDKGQFFGYGTTTQAVKTFYIENMWGNYWQRMAGLVNDAGTIKVKMTPPYPTPVVDAVDLTGFISTGVTPSGTSGVYVKTSSFGDTGFIPVSTIGGSATTYHACGLWYNNAGLMYALVGGSRAYDSLCGGRAVFLLGAPSLVSPAVGSALSFL